MNRRDFITSTIATAFTAAFLSRRVSQAEEEKEQAEHNTGWCVEYISPPAQPDMATSHTAYIPIVNHDD